MERRMGIAAAAVLGLLSAPLAAQTAGVADAPAVSGTASDYEVPPRLLKHTKPKYPKDAYRKKIQGVVLLEFVVDEKGRVADARVLEAVPGLNQAALDTIESWRFAPATVNGVPVRVKAQAPVAFCIDATCPVGKR